MQFSRINFSYSVIRNELILYLQENKNRLRISEQHVSMKTGWIWVENATNIGISIQKLTEELALRLQNKKLITIEVMPVNNSEIMHTQDAYNRTKLKVAITEIIFEFIRLGIVLPVKFKRESQQNFEVTPHSNFEHIILSDYGAKYIEDSQVIPYYAEKYIDLLKHTGNPDEELITYLAEGLTCLQNQLGRAAAVLLRLSTEHTLGKLEEALQQKLIEPQKEEFTRKIKSKRMFEDRIELLIDDWMLKRPDILTNNGLKNSVKNQLKPSIHAIREVGNKAAHISQPMQLENIRDLYTLYANTVYRISSDIIRHWQEA